MSVATDHALPKRTPLHALHLAHGAKMVPFAGYEMPLHYKPGLLREHLHTRAAAGLFDVSHMGQLAIVPRSGRYQDAARALEASRSTCSACRRGASATAFSPMMAAASSTT